MSDGVLAAERRLAAGRHTTPHEVLGAHPATVGGVAGTVVRAFHPDATAVDVLAPDGRATAAAARGNGVFTAFLAGAPSP